MKHLFEKYENGVGIGEADTGGRHSVIPLKAIRQGVQDAMDNIGDTASTAVALADIMKSIGIAVFRLDSQDSDLKKISKIINIQSDALRAWGSEGK